MYFTNLLLKKLKSLSSISLIANGFSDHFTPLPSTVALFEMFAYMLMTIMSMFSMINKWPDIEHDLYTNQENSHSVIASYQRAVAPWSPGRRDTVIGACQEADLGSGWRLLLITQTVCHTAGLPARCSLLHTPSRAADAAV